MLNGQDENYYIYICIYIYIEFNKMNKINELLINIYDIVK